MMTGEIPSKAQVDAISQDWKQRAAALPIPPSLKTFMASHAKQLHPMSLLSASLMAMQSNSRFAEAYASGRLRKDQMWEVVYEDIANVIAILPKIAALIYQNRYGRGSSTAQSKADWAGRFAEELGFTDPTFHELLRLYLTIHADHEGGNVSAHTTHLVASALSDPYLAYAAGLNGLAGPLHGLANQEVLQWTLRLRQELGDSPTDEQLRQYIWKTLNGGQVVPGYGHAVLRKTDPRYICQRQFALRHLPNDPLFKLTSQLYAIVPAVLAEQGKTKNPWPNVDAHSGVLLQHYGLVQQDFYTVLFGVSRALGALSGVFWDRALGFPLERPKSLTTECIMQIFSSDAKVAAAAKAAASE